MIELPPPPCKAYMGAEEITLFGRTMRIPSSFYQILAKRNPNPTEVFTHLDENKALNLRVYEGTTFHIAEKPTSVIPIENRKILLPYEFLEKAKIEDKVMLSGSLEYFEIWNPQEWQIKVGNKKLGKRFYLELERL